MAKQKHIRGLVGKKLIQALANEKGIIDYNCMLEIILGFSIGREEANHRGGVKELGFPPNYQTKGI